MRLDLRVTLLVAIEASLTAGREILAAYDSVDYAVETKVDDSPLTRADRLAHACIATLLEKTGMPILSEEGRMVPYLERMDWARFWLVDPLDGTKEFISRNGEFTVNIAMVEKGRPVLGVVYVPVRDELVFGVVGDGAYMVEEANRCGGGDALMASAVRLPLGQISGRYRVVGSRSHMDERTMAFIDSLRQEHPELEIVQRGSSLKICMVASGEADIYPRFGPTMEWDTAAGHAIAVAAGKRVEMADGRGELVYNKEALLNPFFIVQ